MKTYFSVDVETSSTNPFTGQLLTVGISAVNAENLELMESYHWAIEYERGSADADTLNWWSQQDPWVYEAAWGGDRMPKVDAANEIFDWTSNFDDELSNRIFAANPVSFDYPWVAKLFAEAGVAVPFNHRTMCMRSIGWGLWGGEWGKNRHGNWNVSERPHHAEYDAIAQAKDLVRLCKEVRKRDNVKDKVHVSAADLSV